MYGDEDVELGSDGAFKCGEHGVCVFFVHGDDVKGVVGGGVTFWRGMMYEPSGVGLRCMVEVAKFSLLCCMCMRKAVAASMPSDKAEFR